jgi:hypothetical protein
MNSTKKSKRIRNNPLQHSTRSCLKYITSCKGKRNLAGEMDVCVIACWSRIGGKHTNALMSFNASDTDDDDHNIVDNTDNLVGNLTNQSAASLVYNYSGNAYWNVKKESE